MNISPEDKWIEARKRMEPYIEAVFWQDLDVPAKETKESMDWILDRLFKPEFMALLIDRWEVWRQDDNGNHFRMNSGLPHDEAKKIVEEYEAKGHKQFYWILPENRR